MQREENSYNSPDDNLDLGKIFRIILMQSKLIIIILSISVAVSAIYYIFSPKIYRVSSVIQVDAGSYGMQGSEIPMDFLNGGGGSSNLDDLITLYKSRSNIAKIITGLNLNIISDEELLYEVINEFNLTSDLKNISYFKIEFKESFYNLYNSETLIGNKLQYNMLNEVDNVLINLNFNQALLKLNVELQVINPELLIKRYQSNIFLSIINKSRYYSPRGGLIKVFYNTDDVDLGKKILDLGNKIFIENDLEVQNQKAARAIGFIDERLASINSVLENDKLQLSMFQENNSTLDVDIEVESIIKSLSEIELSINKLDLEIAKMETSYTNDNPLFKQALNQKNLLVQQKSEVESKIRLLPVAQQRYIDLYRNVNISEELYKELLNRRLSLSILEASTLGNIRIIDDAYRDFLVSPKLSNALYFMIFMSFVSILVTIIRGLYFLSMSNPAEIPDGGIKIPIMGIFPFLDENEKIKSQYEQSIESLIVNIQTLKKSEPENKIIAITSPTKENGKSTTSLALASKIANLNYKVLLIDADYKRGSLHKELGQKTLSVDSINNISGDNLKDLEVSNNLYFIPRISKLNDTFRWVSSGSLQNLIEDELLDKFDYIIIDTAPVLSVSDTSLILGISHMNFLLVRHKLSRFVELKHSIENVNQIGVDFDGIIYNAYKKPEGYFGYYNYYGNYQYQYYASRYLNDDYYYEKD